MPFIGLGAIHLLIAIFFAVHAIRHGQPLYWVIILISFPLIGSLVYFFAIYLPASRLEQGARKVVSRAIEILDPEREYREADAEFKLTPTAQNQMRLARAQLKLGRADDAAQNYEACLRGPLASDPDIRLGAAEAFLASGRVQDSLKHIESILKERPNYRPEEMGLLLARVYAEMRDIPRAEEAFARVYQEFGGFDVTAYYAIWSLSCGETARAQTLYAETQTIRTRWSKHSHKLNALLVRALERAFSQHKGAA